MRFLAGSTSRSLMRCPQAPGRRSAASLAKMSSLLPRVQQGQVTRPQRRQGRRGGARTGARSSSRARPALRSCMTPAPGTGSTPTCQTSHGLHCSSSTLRVGFCRWVIRPSIHAFLSFVLSSKKTSENVLISVDQSCFRASGCC